MLAEKCIYYETDKLSLKLCFKNKSRERIHKKSVLLNVVGSLLYIRICTHPDIFLIVDALEHYHINSKGI